MHQDYWFQSCYLGIHYPACSCQVQNIKVTARTNPKSCDSSLTRHTAWNIRFSPPSTLFRQPFSCLLYLSISCLIWSWPRFMILQTREEKYAFRLKCSFTPNLRDFFVNVCLLASATTARVLTHQTSLHAWSWPLIESVFHFISSHSPSVVHLMPSRISTGMEEKKKCQFDCLIQTGE